MGALVLARRRRRNDCGQASARDVRIGEEFLRCDARQAALGRAARQGSQAVMLRHLRATNFAILSDVEIELGDGMNVLTGETGAGKSLIVEAVNLLRGGRASADIPRTGADEAVVEATVEVPEDLRARVAGVLDGAGLPHNDDEEVFVRRVIHRGGGSRCYVNGALTTAARLAELGALLIDLSGQHQHQGLVDPARHLEILDLFADEPALGAAMDAAWSELKRCDEVM